MRYDSDKKLWIYMHRNHRVDHFAWQPQEAGRRRNNLKSNSFVPESVGPIAPEVLDKWQQSIHKEQSLSMVPPPVMHSAQEEKKEAV